MSRAEKRPATRTDKVDKTAEKITEKEKATKSGRPDSAGTSNQSKTGTFIFKDGSRYEGEYREIEPGIIVRSGTGKYSCGTTKNIYVGAWDQDKMHGKGRLEFASGASYDGLWVDNQYCGTGSYKWPDGATLSGEWFENSVNGPSKYTDRRDQGWIGQVFKGVAATLAPEL